MGEQGAVDEGAVGHPTTAAGAGVLGGCQGDADTGVQSTAAVAWASEDRGQAGRGMGFGVLVSRGGGVGFGVAVQQVAQDVA